jgi:predicted nucleic acid-binding protein
VILVDSSVWIDYFRGAESREVAALDRLLGTDLLAIGDLILVEVLQGFDEERVFNLVRRRLAELTVVVLGGPDIAVQAARNFRLLRRRGVTVRKTIDTVIATRCIQSGLRLLHSDRDFEPFVKHLGLRTVIDRPRMN